MEKNKLVFQPTNCLSQAEIRQYLIGDIDENSRYRVENHLLDCPLCAEALEGFSQESSLDPEKEIEDLKSAVIRKSKSNTQPLSAIFWTMNRIAAVLLFLVISAAVIIYWNAQSSEKTFLADFQSSKDLIEIVRGGEDSAAEYNEGIELYRNEYYQESLFFFENLLEVQPENSTAHYFSGLSAMKLGEMEKAIENLTYARINSEKHYEAATWHLALANLGLEKIEETKALITDLLKIEGGFYSEKAENLLKQIEEK